MADEPIVAASGAADLGGGGGGDAAAAAPAAPAAPAADAGSQSDEQILGIDPIGVAPAKTVEPVVPKTEPVADPNAVKTPEALAAENLAEDGRLMPVKWRDMAAKDPEFRTLFYQNRVNAEKLATMEPKFTEAQTTLAEVARADAAWLSGDATAIQTELKSFIGDKPDSVLPMIQAGEQLLKTMLPEEFARVTGERLVSSLKEINFDKGLEFLRSALDADNADGLKAQATKFLEYFDSHGFPTTDAARIAQRTAQLDARDTAHAASEQTAYLGSQETFRTAVNTEMNSSIQGGIKTSLDTLLKGAAFTDGARKRIDAEVFSEINKMLHDNKDIPDQINRVLFPNGFKDANGKPARAVFNATTQRAAIDAPVTYAKSVLQDVIKRVVENYTKDFMAADSNRQARVAAAGARTDVMGGGDRQRAPKPLTKKDVDYSRMSDDDILGA
jgi:hypothetical protein